MFPDNIEKKIDKEWIDLGGNLFLSSDAYQLSLRKGTNTRNTRHFTSMGGMLAAIAEDEKKLAVSLCRDNKTPLVAELAKSEDRYREILCVFIEKSGDIMKLGFRHK